MMSDFVFWKSSLPRRPGYTSATALYGPDDVVSVDQLALAGASLSREWPSQAHTVTSPESKKGALLADAVDWYEPLLLVNSKLLERVQSHPDVKVESFGVRIVDRHTREALSEDHHAIHVLEVHPAFDLEASELKWSRSFPDQIKTFRKCVLDTANLPTDLAMFRPVGRPQAVLVRSDLAAWLSEAEFVGLSMVAPRDYRR